MIPSEIVRMSAARMPTRNERHNRSVVSRIINQSKQLRNHEGQPSQSEGKTPRDIESIKSRIRLRLVPVRRKSEEKRQTERDSQLMTPPLLLEELRARRKQQKQQIQTEEGQIQQQFYRQVKILQQFKKLSKLVN